VINEEPNETVCSNCGVVITDKLVDMDKQGNSMTKGNDTTPRVMTFQGSAAAAATTSLAIHYGGLSTMIGKTNRDASGQQIDVEMRARINRLRIWDTRSRFRDCKETNLSARLMQLQRLKEILALPNSVIEKRPTFIEKHNKEG